MFERSAVEEYRSVTAPEILKNRVFQNASTKKRPLRVITLIGALAACLILLFTQTWMGTLDDVLIASNWELQPAASASFTAGIIPRSSVHYASFTLAVRDELVLESNDSLFVVNENNEIVDTFPYKTSEIVTVYWYVTSPRAAMTVNGVPYSLIADENDGTFQIVQD